MILPEHVKEQLLVANRLVVFTGAGISAESGIATFRGTDGIWKKFKPEELANFNAFLRNPDMVWEWYQYRRTIIDEKKPNAAHYAITGLESYFQSVIVVTQNVDNLHRRAGNSLVYELHGNIEKNYCIKCHTRYDYQKFGSHDKVPHCTCGGLIRPDIVWFGEYLPDDQFEPAMKAAQNCDMLLSVGTSGVVYPAAYIPLKAKDYGRFLIEINTDATEQTHIFDAVFPAKAGEVLPEILEFVKEHREPIGQRSNHS